MNELPALHDLIPLLPELVLACGAMAMLMLGVAIGERSSAVVNGFCFIILLLAGAALSSVPPGSHALFGGGFLLSANPLAVLGTLGSGYVAARALAKPLTAKATSRWMQAALDHAEGPSQRTMALLNLNTQLLARALATEGLGDEDELQRQLEAAMQGGANGR